MKEILDYFLKRDYPKEGELIGYVGNRTKVTLSYYHPNKYNELFLGIDWLSRLFFRLVNMESLYSILISILLEQSLLFVSDNIQDLTTMVLGFSYLISPFKWPFILIPNLPLDLVGMIDSPVPYLIGILGISNFKANVLHSDIPATLVYIQGKTIQVVKPNDDNSSKLPRLGNLKHIVKTDLDMASYYLNLKMTEEYFKYCQKIYKNIYEILKGTLADPLEKLLKQHVNSLKRQFSLTTVEEIDDLLSDKSDNLFLNSYIAALDPHDRLFASLFTKTQIFYSYFDELKVKEFKL
jgi:hypothetical protein